MFTTAACPTRLIQLVHGMSEHVERYADFAAYLCSQGFAVCANDHVGHGKSVSCEEDLGHMAPATVVPIFSLPTCTSCAAA